MSSQGIRIRCGGRDVYGQAKARQRLLSKWNADLIRDGTRHDTHASALDEASHVALRFFEEIVKDTADLAMEEMHYWREAL